MNKRQLLIVDDDEHIRNMFSRAFSDAGYIVTTASSAEEALELQRKHGFGVLFLDLDLPGMNGIELCRQIRKLWPMSIAYAVTGYASLFELSDCREAGFEDYFTKPANLSEILATASHAFNKQERWRRREKPTGNPLPG